MQGVRRGGDLPAQSDSEPVQGMRRGQHLPARSDKEQVQDVQSRQGRVDAARSRGALELTEPGLLPHLFCPCRVSFGPTPSVWGLMTYLRFTAPNNSEIHFLGLPSIPTAPTLSVTGFNATLPAGDA